MCDGNPRDSRSRSGRALINQCCAANFGVRSQIFRSGILNLRERSGLSCGSSAQFTYDEERFAKFFRMLPRDLIRLVHRAQRDAGLTGAAGGRFTKQRLSHAVEIRIPD